MRRASESPTAAQRAPPRCTGPVGLADTYSRLMERPARVSLRPYAAPASTMVRASSPAAPAPRRMLMKPGPATSTESMPSSGGEVVGEDLRELARRHAGLLAELHGDVGRPVTVLAHARTLDRHGVGHQGRVDGDAPGGGSVQQRRANKRGKFFRSHPFRLRGFRSSPLTHARCACENLATRGPPGRLSSRREGREASNISGSRTFFYL